MLAQDKLPFHRKITYGFTDMSGNLLYCIISSYMLYFSPMFSAFCRGCGSFTIIGRIFDAIGTPIMGILVDTHSKYGKSRPWFLREHCHLQYLFGYYLRHRILLTRLGIYAGVMYILADFHIYCYAAPITSVLPNLTTNTDDR